VARLRGHSSTLAQGAVLLRDGLEEAEHDQREKQGRNRSSRHS
jgi:hypothetical protein